MQRDNSFVLPFETHERLNRKGRMGACGVCSLYTQKLVPTKVEATHTERVTVRYWYHNLNMRPGFQYFFPMHSCCGLQWFEPIFQITLSSSLAPAILSLALPLSQHSCLSRMSPSPRSFLQPSYHTTCFNFLQRIYHP